MSAHVKIVAVAAAVLLQEDDREFLLACRPEGKVYAGYWEFPGGKVEPGESVRDALVRELQEELDITITAADPWLVRRFTYPHATVNLSFFRVRAWEGKIHPKEHSDFAWIKVGQPPLVAPILPANDPILKALALPSIMAVSNAVENGVDIELQRIDQALARGLKLFQIRDKTLSPAARKAFAVAATQRITQGGGIALINDDPALAREANANGLHLSSHSLTGLEARPDFTWVGASCHSADDLEKAARLGLDYAVLGPVLPTPTHPEASGLGWEAFGALIKDTPLPVFAIGGMKTDLLGSAQSQSAHGIALMRGW